MNFTNRFLLSLPESFHSINVKPSFDDNSAATSITFFDKPLSNIEMDYFNNTVVALQKIIRENIGLLSDDELQYSIYYKIKSLDDLHNFFDFSNNSQIKSLEHSFNSELKFNHISSEQILYLMSYIYFDKIGEDANLSIEAKNGNVYFSHKTVNNFTPRVRDRLSLFLSLFFNSEQNILNGISSDNQRVIEPRKYLTLLDCLSYQKSKINQYSYLMSNNNSLSINNTTWATLSQSKYQDILVKFYDHLSEFLFEKVNSHAETLEHLKNKVAPICYDMVSSFLQENTDNADYDIFDKNLLKSLPQNIVMRYNFSEIKFREFFSNINRTKELYQNIHNTEVVSKQSLATKRKI